MFTFFSYLAPHAFVYSVTNVDHSVLRRAPLDLVSPGHQKRVVGCASRIINKGVMSEFKCLCSFLIQRLSASIVGFFGEKQIKKIS